MILTSRVIRLASLLVVLAWGSTAQAQYLLTPGPGGAVPPTGGELQIGTGLPLPIGPAGIYLGGMAPGTAGPAFYPPLLVPPASNITAGGLTRTIMGAATIVVPPAVLAKAAPGAPVPIGVFTTNPVVFQVATTIGYSWPSSTATFSTGGAPGPVVLGTGGAGGVITYSGGAKSFGGPAQFAIAAGPGSVGGRVPPNTMGALPVASVWINFKGALPTSVMTVGIVGASAPAGVAQPGAPVASPAGTTMFGPVVNSAMTAPNGIGIVNVPVGGGGCTMFCVTPMGAIPSSAQPGAAFLSNMVTGSKGFPWTTGFITISQPGAAPPEIFYLSGTDMRVGGVGNLSMVSGSLSTRALSGPNANRGWVSLNLPEPTMALGAAGALAMLALCHGLVRRRSS